MGSTSPVSPGWTYGGRQAQAGGQGEGCDCYTDPNTSPLSRGIAFEPPELPEETLMEVLVPLSLFHFLFKHQEKMKLLVVLFNKCKLYCFHFGESGRPYEGF